MFGWRLPSQSIHWLSNHFKLFRKSSPNNALSIKIAQLEDQISRYKTVERQFRSLQLLLQLGNQFSLFHKALHRISTCKEILKCHRVVSILRKHNLSDQDLLFTLTVRRARNLIAHPPPNTSLDLENQRLNRIHQAVCNVILDLQRLRKT